MNIQGMLGLPSEKSELDWCQRGACNACDPALFFPDHSANTIAYKAEAKTAKAICGRCVVIDKCLRWAIEKEEHDVWGGTTAYERRRLVERGLVEEAIQMAAAIAIQNQLA